MTIITILICTAVILFVMNKQFEVVGKNQQELYNKLEILEKKVDQVCNTLTAYGFVEGEID